MGWRHVAVAGLALVAVACVGASHAQVPARTLTTFDGDEVSLADTYAGEALVVNFWASWCPPCKEEMPTLEALHQELGDEITFLGINLQDDRQAAERTAQVTGVTYTLAEDPWGELYAELDGFSMPMTYLVDRDGVVVALHAGIGTEQQLRRLIDDHLRS